MNTTPNPISFMESIGAKVTNLNAALVEVTNEVEANLEQPLQPHLETLKSTYSEELLRSRFAEKGFDLENYVFEALHKEIVVISELTGDKNRMTDGFIYAEGNLDVLKRALREVKMGNSYNIYSILETAGEVNVESIPDEFCGNVVLKTLALGELKPIIESEYKKHRIDAKQVHLGIKESKVAELSQKVGDEIAALKIARRELTGRINSGESVQNRLTATAANIKSERAGYSDIQTQERTQSITTLQPVEQVRTDPTVLAGVAKRLLEQRELDQETKIIRTAKDTTQDPSPTTENPVLQIDSLQIQQELLKAERQAEDFIVKGFELRIANYKTEKEIAKLRIVNKELLGMMTDHTTQIPSNLNLLLGKINKFKDNNQTAMIIPRLRNTLIEKALFLGIELNETIIDDKGRLYNKIEDFDFPEVVTFDSKTQEYFESFIANPANAKLLPKILNLATSFNRYCERGGLINVSNFYGFAISDNGGFTKKSFFLIMNCENPKYLKKGLRNFIEFKLTSEKRIYITLNEQGQYQLYTTNEYFNGIH